MQLLRLFASGSLFSERRPACHKNNDICVTLFSYDRFINIKGFIFMDIGAGFWYNKVQLNT